MPANPGPLSDDVALAGRLLALAGRVRDPRQALALARELVDAELARLDGSPRPRPEVPTPTPGPAPRPDPLPAEPIDGPTPGLDPRAAAIFDAFVGPSGPDREAVEAALARVRLPRAAPDAPRPAICPNPSNRIN